MKFVLDTHTHTIASGHAYSTIQEMISAAQKQELSLLGITEHAPKMPGTCSPIYFLNLKVIPRKYDNLEVFFGVEANIIDYNGTLDLDESILSCLNYTIASLHLPCIPSGTMEENTNAYLGAIKNPYVNIIGHPDDARFPIHQETLVKAAKEHHVLLEMNNTSLSPNSFRPNARENYHSLLALCKEYEVPIVIGSDAHISYDVGNFAYAKALLEEIHFPEHLIANTSVEKFKALLQRKRG